MSHVINSVHSPAKSRVLTSQFTHCKCTATQLSICSYRGHRIAAVTRCVLPCSRTSIVSGNSVRATSVKRQNSARNNAKCSKCFQFFCNNSDRTWFFNALTVARSSASVFNTSHGTWRMLMHEKPCLIPLYDPLY